MEKLRSFVKKIIEQDRFVEKQKSEANLRSKICMQIFTAFAFLILSVANIIAHSYTMLALTAAGCVINTVFVFLAQKKENSNLCSVSAIATCSALFAFFVVYGGNDGFACLWVILLPLVAMVAMNFKAGLVACVFFQIFLIVVLWTPVRDMLFYQYNEQFCLRFPLFFFVTLILGLILTVSMRTSEYNEIKRSLELEELNARTKEIARTDPLTKLANRRFVYEQIEERFSVQDKPRCIVMGDIDNFKSINDTYGHMVGDEVLVVFAEYIKKLLPQDYLKSRWGGEEFLFAANARIDEVFVAVDNLRKAIAEHKFMFNGTQVRITITFGIAEYSDTDGLSKAISCADKRMYHGKTTTKNCIVISD